VTVRLTGRADRDLSRLDPPDRQRVRTAIERLPDGDIVRMVGVEPKAWRLRVGDWRVMFARDPEDEDRFVILRVRHRRDAYR
jgi:mRNA-degrading endonuclease RelE of RelBE toxin-antitoxin system